MFDVLLSFRSTLTLTLTSIGNTFCSVSVPRRVLDTCPPLPLTGALCLCGGSCSRLLLLCQPGRPVPPLVWSQQPRIVHGCLWCLVLSTQQLPLSLSASCILKPFARSNPWCLASRVCLCTAMAHWRWLWLCSKTSTYPIASVLRARVLV